MQQSSDGNNFCRSVDSAEPLVTIVKINSAKAIILKPSSEIRVKILAYIPRIPLIAITRERMICLITQSRSIKFYLSRRTVSSSDCFGIVIISIRYVGAMAPRISCSYHAVSLRTVCKHGILRTVISNRRRNLRLHMKRYSGKHVFIIDFYVQNSATHINYKDCSMSDAIRYP